MILISIEKQRTRPPFFQILFGNARHFWNCVWLTDGRGAGGQGHTSQRKIYQMLPIDIEKQRNRPPFLKLCLGTRLSRRKNNIGLFIFTISNAFDYYWKAKETLAFLQILFDGRMSGEPAGEGARLGNGNIFEDCLFLLLRMLPNSIEKQRNRKHFFKFSLAKETPPIFEI